MANSTSLLRAESSAVYGRHVQVIRDAVVYWHLLSLDAPTVAMLWTWFVARVYRIQLPAASVFAIGVAVWILYAFDRLLDSRSFDSRSSDSRHSLQTALEPRHHFHRKHQIAFCLGIVLASMLLALLLTHVAYSSVRLYALLAVPLAAYFSLIHMQRRNSTCRPKRHLPKEIAVGIFFSAATFIPTVALAPALRSQLLPSAFLFGLVCSVNCLFIYAWEHPSSGANGCVNPDAHSMTRYALRFLPQLSSLILLGCLGLVSFASSLPTWPLPTAIALTAILLLLLHQNHHHFEATTLRASADLCLLTPLLFALSLAL